jgi:tetratricopeptide (TPR) repeat protein
MKVLTPGFFEKGQKFGSITLHGRDRHYLVVQTDLRSDGPEGVNPYQPAYWSYAALGLDASANRGLPPWIISGLREVASNINVTDKLLQVGRAMPAHVRRLAGPLPFPLEALFRVTYDSADYRNVDRRRDYDAECWALMQYMMFGGVAGSERQGDVNRIAAELLKGRPAADVVTEVYGGTEKLDIALRKFISTGLYRYQSLKVNAAIDQKAFTARPLAPADEWRMRAGVFAASSRWDDVRTAAEQIRTLDPSGPGAAEIEGQLFESDNKAVEAQAAYEKAVAAKSADYYAYYRLASILWARPNDDAAIQRIDALVARSVELNDQYSVAQTLRAYVLLRLNRAGEALGPAKRAVDLRPDLPGPRLGLAEVRNKLGDSAGAVELAQNALALSRTDEDRRRAQDAIVRFSKK